MNQRQRIFLIVLLGALLVFFAFNAPLNAALNIGGDDHFELCKAQLLNRDPAIAERLHNDHPWLHTMIIAKAFALLGEHAAIPRVFCLLLTGVLVIASWHLLGPQAKLLDCTLFVCVYFTSTRIAALSTSAMLEPPAIALAVLAVACSYSVNGPLSRRRAYTSGFLIGMAASVKLTALLIGPAWLLLLWQQRKLTPVTGMVSRLVGGGLVALLVVVALSPSMSFDMLWFSHWRAQEAIITKPESGHVFAITDVFNDWTIFVAVCAGVVVATREKSPANAGSWFALVWLLTDFAAHIWHRPWWSYYSIHFHIPVAILAARGAASVIRSAWNSISLKTEVGPIEGAFPVPRWVLRKDVFASLIAILAAFMISCWAGIRLPYAVKEWEEVHHKETAGETVFVPAIRKYAGQARWIYCTDLDMAFHGGVLQPPELILRTYKRLVTGDLSRDTTYEIAKRYNPELLLLYREGEMQDERFKRLLGEGKYVRVAQSEAMELWASPELHPTEATSPESLIGRLGL